MLFNGQGVAARSFNQRDPAQAQLDEDSRIPDL
jgi:hypothetical protein